MAERYAYLMVQRHRYELTADVSEVETAAPRHVAEALHDLRAGAADFKTQLGGTLMAQATLAGGVANRGHAAPTPGRMQHVARLIEAGLLKQADADALFADGRVPDGAWSVLSRVHADQGEDQVITLADDAATGPPTPQVVESWRLQVYEASKVRTLDIDPLEHPARALPIHAVLSALDDLHTDGWRLVHSSEDRAIDDDATHSHVVSQRFLLQRAD